MADPFLVSITSLRRSPGARRHEHRSGSIGELRVASTVLAAPSEVEVEVVLDVVDGGIEVSGEVRAHWQGECRRCLRLVTGDLGAQVRELYRPRSPGETDDEETYPLAGELLDLRPLARDAVLLELPLAPLCRPDCAGLCPTCGQDLNEDDCGCAGAVRDIRWSGLDALRLSDEAELIVADDSPIAPGEGADAGGTP